MDQARQKVTRRGALAALLTLGAGKAFADCAQDTPASQQSALRDVERWTMRMQREDPRYREIEKVLLKKVDLVIKAMPSIYWVPTLQLMYAAVQEAYDLPRPPAGLRF